MRSVATILLSALVVIWLAGCAATKDTETHWAFISLKPLVDKQAKLPKTPGTDWPRNGVDDIAAWWFAKYGLQPRREANPRMLLRRVHFDLIGLPPTPKEIAAFEADLKRDPSTAHEKVVDRLLASPHFGEKWARWWMDLAHYGDSDGYLTDQLRPVAWRWRQWVVEAFNRNLPFDQFTIEQLAGDLLPNATTQQRIATGFLRNTLSNREGGADLEEFRVLQVKDRASTYGTVWLGLTVGCAQCHDHKYDPVTQREFYQLYAIFNRADELNINAPLPGEAEPYDAARKVHKKKRQELLSPVATQLDALQKRWETKLLLTEAHPGRDHHWDRELELLGLIWGGHLGEGQLEGLNIIHKPWPDRTAIERERIQDYFLSKGSRIDGEQFKKLKINELVRQLNKLKADLPSVTRAPTMVRHHAPRSTHLHLRGNFRRRGDRVQPGLPAVLNAGNIPDRLALARWTVSPDNPLTARVTMNRLWLELFGNALVDTPEDFGTRGDVPQFSNRHMLDWLAAEFIRQQWDMKAVLRLMVTSSLYRQTSDQSNPVTFASPQAVSMQFPGVVKDAFVGHGRQRLSGELIRDNALAVSGLLNRKIGGPSVRPPQPASVIKEAFGAKWEASKDANRYRRGLYTFIQRTAPFAQSVTFDFPDNNQPCARRERSNTPLQALNLLNDPVFFECAQALATRVLREGGPTTRERLNRAYLLCFAREPSGAERARLEKYLADQVALLKDAPEDAKTMAGKPLPGIARADQAAWVGVASVLMNLDEFITKE